MLWETCEFRFQLMTKYLSSVWHRQGCSCKPQSRRCSRFWRPDSWRGCHLQRKPSSFCQLQKVKVRKIESFRDILREIITWTEADNELPTAGGWVCKACAALDVTVPCPEETHGKIWKDMKNLQDATIESCLHLVERLIEHMYWSHFVKPKSNKDHFADKLVEDMHNSHGVKPKSNLTLRWHIRWTPQPRLPRLYTWRAHTSLRLLNKEEINADIPV